MYDRILVPTDGSASAENAFDHALDLARTYDAELHVLYAVDVPPGAIDAGASMLQSNLETEGTEAVELLADRAEREGFENVTTAVEPGRVHEVILNYAEEEDVDLVVMGTHGRTGLDRYLLGSVTEKVVRLSDVPVLTVRAPEESE